MQLLTLASSAALTGVAAAALYNQSNVNHTCVLNDPVLSCSAQANPLLVDSCCAETFGGLVLSTQYWNTYTDREAEGQKLPPKSWTIHGLWPDFCNGSYTQYCDLSRQFDPDPYPNTTNGLPNGTVVEPWTGPNVGTFLEKLGKFDLLAYMNRFWTGRREPSHVLWAHEFSKHATCFSTFDIPCYGPEYVEHEDVVDYFETTILFDRKLPTYDWLSEKGIEPSNSTCYSLSDLQAALTDGYGATPYIGCSGPRYNTTSAGEGSSDGGFTVVSEVWYFSHVYGRPQEGNSVALNATGSQTNCAKAAKALHYYERAPGSEHEDEYSYEK